MARRSGLSGFRSMLYKLARLLGHAQAVCKGKVGKRIARRGRGKATGRGLGKVFKGALAHNYICSLHQPILTDNFCAKIEGFTREAR